MGVLGNIQHERFCQEYHKLAWSGTKPQDARVQAYKTAGFETKDEKYIAANARKLSYRVEVAARLKELHDYAAKLSGLDAAWALVQLKNDVEEIKSFNLDNYLTPVDSQGNRYFDLSKVSPEQMALLSELTIDSAHEDGGEGEAGREVRKIKLKGPDKYSNRATIIRLMADIAGWKAPEKVEQKTTHTLASLIEQSLDKPQDAAPKEPAAV